MLGRIGTNFAAAQDAYLRSLLKKRTGLRWTQALINKLWDTAWDMWQFRNGIKHNTITPQIQRELNEVGDLLRQQLIIGTTGVRPRDAYLINSIDRTLTKPLYVQQRCLDCIKLARTEYALAQATVHPQLVAQQMMFRNFFAGARGQDTNTG
jgi:hypothetical protein